MPPYLGPKQFNLLTRNVYARLLQPSSNDTPDATDDSLISENNGEKIGPDDVKRVSIGADQRKFSNEMPSNKNNGCIVVLRQ